MRMIANINGKDVYSDKTVRAIIGTKVVFNDNSWCDVKTGEVVNKGPGQINIGAIPEKSSSEAKEIKKVFPVRDLQISNVVGSIRILPHNKEEVEITLRGSESILKGIEVSKEDESAVIRNKKSSGSGVFGSVTCISGNVSGTIISGRGNIIIGGPGGNVIITDGACNGESGLIIEAKVPKKASLDISEVNGKISIGDIEGSLYLNISGDANIKCGKVGKTNASVTGSADLSISEINGDAKLKVTGNGDIRVNGGNINDLEISIAGSGDVTVHATAQTAELSIGGSGDIRVNKVVKKPRRAVGGSGDIWVGNW